MGIISKLANTKLYERGANYELGQSISGSGVSNIFGSGGAQINVLQEYSGYVWKAVNIRSEDLSSQSIFVERKVGDKWQKDTNHDFNDVLEGDEGSFDLSELLEAHQVCMDMYGESFWYFSMAESSTKPYAVYLLNPAHVQVYVANEKVTGYVYDYQGDHIVLDTNEVAHFRIYNPAYPFRGAGPMQKAGWFIRSNRYVTTYVNNFLENNAIPAGVIVSKTNTNEDDWKLFKEAWANAHSGINNAGKTGFVRGELEFVKTGLSLGEIDFEKIKNASRDDILAMFSVPKSKLGLYEDFKYASAVTTDPQFARLFTKQAVMRLTRRLSRKVSAWYGEEYRVGTDFVVPEDREQKLNEFDKGVGRWVSVNEAREAYGLEKLGKEFDTITPITAPLPTPAPAKALGTVKIRLKNTKAGFTYEMKEDFRSKGEAIQLKYEQEFLQATNKALEDQRQRVMDQLMPKKLVQAHLDAQKESELMVEATLGVELALAVEQGELAAEFAGNADTTFKLTPIMENYIRDSLMKASLSFTQETIDKIATLLHDGIETGDSIASIAKEIGKVYDDVTGVETPGYRIERLARTEVIKTSNEITEAAYIQSGVVNKKEWFANPGCCEFCASLNGSIIRLGGTFVQKGSTLEGVDGGTRMNDYEDVNHPPTHPACRCTLLPVVEGANE